MVVGDGAHHAADGETVEVVVDEDQHAQQEGREHRADAGLDVLFGPAAEGGAAAGAVDERHDDAQQHQEQEDAGVVADRGDETVVDDGVERPDEIEIRHEQRPEQHAREERDVSLLDEQRQHDGDDGGHEGPDGTVHGKTSRKKDCHEQSRYCSRQSVFPEGDV